MIKQAIDRELYLELRRIRLKHWYRVLIDGFRRLKQHSLVILLCLGSAIPAILVIFLPVRTLLTNHDPASNIFPTGFIQALSWLLVLMQKDAIANDQYERYLCSLPLPDRLRARLALQMTLLSNHLLWAIAFPAVAFLLLEFEISNVFVGMLKISILIYATVSLQLRYLDRRAFPWGRLIVVNMLFIGGCFFYGRGEPALALSGVAGILLCVHLRTGKDSQILKTSAAIVQSLTRRVLLCFSPWASLYFYILFARRSLICRGHLAIVAVVLALSAYLLQKVSGSYRFWLLLYTTFGFVFIVNGLYYQFKAYYALAQKLMESWPVSLYKMHRLNVQTLLVVNILLGGVLYLYAYLQDFIDLRQLLFLGLTIVVYTPLMYFIAVKSKVNSMAYTGVAVFPCLAWALALFY